MEISRIEVERAVDILDDITWTDGPEGLPMCICCAGVMHTPQCRLGWFVAYLKNVLKEDDEMEASRGDHF